MSEGQSNGGSTSGAQATRAPTLWGYVSQDMTATTLFTLRMTTIVSTFVYVLSTLGVIGQLMYSAYLNAMLSAFFTFALRLYQRKTQSQISFFSRDMLALLSTEDSGHYIIYTLFFYYQLPFSIYLLPPLLYAIVFTHTYTEGLKQHLPLSIQKVVTSLNNRIRGGQREAFRFIAYTEIFILLVVLWNVISGYMFILAPLLYYHFLKNRYQSQRNPYVRNSFSELRHGVEQLARNPKCPAFLSSLITSSVAFISRLAPAEQVPRQTQ